MPLFRPDLQSLPNPGLRPEQGISRYPQLLGDLIGGLEANAPDIQGQPVGILGDLGNGGSAIGLVDAHRPGGAHPVGLQEHHDLPDGLLFRPGGGHPLPPLGTDPRQFFQPLRGGFNHLEHGLPKGPHQLLGKVGTDAFDHPRPQILLDPGQRRWRNALEGVGLELQTMLAIIDPDAHGLDELTRRHGGGIADDRYQLAPAFHLDPEHTETGFLAMESDALNAAGQAFAGFGERGGRGHGPIWSVANLGGE